MFDCLSSQCVRAQGKCVGGVPDRDPTLTLSSLRVPRGSQEEQVVVCESAKKDGRLPAILIDQGKVYSTYDLW